MYKFATSLLPVHAGKRRIPIQEGELELESKLPVLAAAFEFKIAVSSGKLSNFSQHSKRLAPDIGNDNQWEAAGQLMNRRGKIF